MDVGVMVDYHNAFSITKHILPMDAGVMVDYHTQKKNYHSRLRLG